MPQNLLYLFLTAAAVSADSLLAGFSLALNKQKSYFLPPTVAAVTLALCTAAMFAGNFLSSADSRYADYLGAAILVTVGALNIFKKDDESDGFGTEKVSFSQSAAVGFAVGFDAAAANLSLAFMGYGSFGIPVLFAVTHFFTVYLGQWLAQRNTRLFAVRTGIMSGTVLIALALIKLLP